MQVVILAAGMGKRLKSKTKEHTKSMVEFLGKTFLEHSLDKVTKFDISRIVIVIGYCGDEIKNVIGDNYNGVPVVYVNNEVYATTNNIYSLYLTKDYLVQEDTLLLESDLIYEDSIIEKLINHPYPNLAVVDKYKAYMDGTVVMINDSDEIVSFIPKEHFHYSDIENYYKTVNIYKFSKDFLRNDYLPFLEAYCKTMGNNQYYEQVLRVLLSLERNNMHVLKLSGEKWYEVDDLQDYDIAETIFCEDKEEKLKKYHSRYGGYWRFDGLKDFCYLVNPYFPTKKMNDELKNNFEELLINYPSGQSVDKILIANTFNLKEENVILGNGAAELINTLIPQLSGDIGVILPTFQEYPVRISDSASIHYFIPENRDFSYTVNDLMKFSEEIDTLILVNPDNPSGNYIKKSGVMNLLQHLKNSNKKLILDESFVDFSEGSEDNTLLDMDILNEYNNLIVIKSISKSYGVPGIRLGIMASADTKLVENCRKKLPVWNINSFGEYFLQILNKYKKNYKKACEKIASNRNDFHNKLSAISYLHPIKSQANYILCEVLPPYKSADLCLCALEKDFLIKDCQNKMGFNGKQYIRLAVKSKEDNDSLIELLKELEVKNENITRQCVGV